MSVANAPWGLRPRSDRMPGGIALSAALHLLIFALVIFGLPVFFHERVAENAPIAVDLVTIGPQTRATHPNPENPHRHAEPKKSIPGPPVPKPQAKPAPPTPAPPPSAAAPKPQPVPPEANPAPKAPEKTAEAPPLPQSKPVPPPKPLAAQVPPLPKTKPAPPRELVKEEPRTEQKKYNPALFDTLLKNLARNATAPTEEAPPQRESPASGRASSQPKAPLGAELSASEIDLIREQIERCWDVPAGARDAKNLVVQLRVSVNPDGSVREAMIVDQGRMASDPYFRAAAESARRALFNPLCTPLHLPPDKYPLWRNMVLNFSPKDIL